MFENGVRLVKTGRKMCNHFTASPQRKEDLAKICQCCSLPLIALLNYPDTRVGHVNKMYQSLIMNYCALKTAQTSQKHFTPLWNTLSAEDWVTICELEGITFKFVCFAFSDAQKSNANNTALKPFYRKCLHRVVGYNSFDAMTLA